MKAVFIRKYGGVEALEYGDLPEPKLAKGQVLVQVHASCVNPRDWLLREGRYIFRYIMPAFPIILGSDISGVVVDAGPGAYRFRAGDAVFGMQTAFGGMGGYAEYIAIDESALARKPSTISHEEAAGVPCAALTAYSALVRIAQVKDGSRIAIVGASGGVGTYAVQLAKALGATVSTITSTANISLMESLGADTIIDYKQQKFASILNNQDVVFDTIGRESLDKCATVLNKHGRYITTIPNLQNFCQTIISNYIRFLSLNSTRSTHIVLVPADGLALEHIAALMAKGKVHTIIDAVYPLSQVKAAHEKSRTWRTRGKIILHVQ
ncbi:MAG: NADP-dependent oxidoreductase [Acidobacteriota bacterium]